jgi:hypothetical protein
MPAGETRPPLAVTSTAQPPARPDVHPLPRTASSSVQIPRNPTGARSAGNSEEAGNPQGESAEKEEESVGVVRLARRRAWPGSCIFSSGHVA